MTVFPALVHISSIFFETVSSWKSKANFEGRSAGLIFRKSSNTPMTTFCHENFSSTHYLSSSFTLPSLWIVKETFVRPMKNGYKIWLKAIVVDGSKSSLVHLQKVSLEDGTIQRNLIDISLLILHLMGLDLEEKFLLMFAMIQRIPSLLPS